MAEVADLARARHARDAARDRHHREDLPLGTDARVVGRPRGIAHDPHLKAIAGGADEQEQAYGQAQAEDKAQGQGERADPDAGPVGVRAESLAGREHRGAGRGEVPPVRAAVVDQVVHDKAGDVVEHERGEDLVGAQVRPQQRRDLGPEHAGQGTAADHGDDDQRRRPVAEHEPGGRGPDCSHVQLALPTYVPGPHPKGEGGAQPGEQQGGGVDKARRQGTVGGNGGGVHLVVGRQRVVTGGQQQDGDDDGGQRQRRQGHDDLQPPRRIQPALDAHGPGHVAPAIMRPTRWRSASVAFRVPTTRPA